MTAQARRLPDLLNVGARDQSNLAPSDTFRLARGLMESVNEDGLEYKEFGTRSAAGWAYDYGKGRVAYLAPGHLITAMWNPQYEKLQRNAIRWLLGEI